GGGGLGFQRPGPGDSQGADGLDGPGGQLGRAAGFAGEDGAGSGLGIDGVAFAALAPQPAVWARHFQDCDLAGVQVAGQARAVGTGSFHAGAVEASPGAHQESSDAYPAGEAGNWASASSRPCRSITAA